MALVDGLFAGVAMMDWVVRGAMIAGAVALAFVVYWLLFSWVDRAWLRRRRREHEQRRAANGGGRGARAAREEGNYM